MARTRTFEINYEIAFDSTYYLTITIEARSGDHAQGLLRDLQGNNLIIIKVMEVCL